MYSIKIKYHADIEKVQAIEKGNWIDLRCAEDITMEEGEYKLISLGVSMKLPSGFEMNIVPRSSTFKNFGILQTNGFGVVDNSYCGNNDIIMFPAYATRKTTIPKNSRICQFRINMINPQIFFTEVDSLDDSDRGGFGSTGIA